jgi:Icc protein
VLYLRFIGACVLSIYIESIVREPILEIPCVSTAPGGKGHWYWSIPVLCAITKGLPETLDALLVTADLQCVDRDDVPIMDRRLMGEVVAEAIQEMCSHQLLPAAERVGVIIAGDMYAVPSLDKRGGLGDVQGQWDAFGRAFRWVVGVAGNHDSFGGRCEVEAFRRRPGDKYVLNGQREVLDGLSVSGLCGVLGGKGKPWRRTERDTTRDLRAILRARPDILVLHEGPNIPDQKLLGQDLIRDLIDESPTKPLTICGHCHWNMPLAITPGGSQVLNVDGRVVLMVREIPPWLGDVR